MRTPQQPGAPMRKAQSVRCKATSKGSKRRYKRKAVPGSEICRYHGGLAPQVLRKAVPRVELDTWGISDKKENPEELLLRLMTQSYNRAELYRRLLQEAYEAAERLSQTDSIP